MAKTFIRNAKKRLKSKILEVMMFVTVILHRMTGWTLVKTKITPVGAILDLDIRKRLQFLQWLRRSYEPHILAVAKTVLVEGDVVIDVGAHVGWWTLLVGPKGRVLAFEPEPENYGRLVKNIKRNASGNVSAIPAGLSSQSTRAKLHICRRREDG